MLHAWFASGVAFAVYVPASIVAVVPLHITLPPVTPVWLFPLYVLFDALALAVFALAIVNAFVFPDSA